MKILKSILFVALVLQFGGVTGQSFDQTRMDRDLKIAQDVVKSLFKSEGKEGRFYSVNPRASYIDGYGVLINLSGSGYLYSGNFGGDYSYSYDFGNESSVIIDNDAIEELKMQAELAAREAEIVAAESAELHREQARLEKEIAREKRELERKMRELERQESLSKKEKQQLKDLDEQNRKLEEEREQIRDERRDDIDDKRIREIREKVNRVRVVPPVAPNVSVTVGDDDDFFYVSRGGNDEDPEAWREAFQNVSKTFFSDYADLIGQLKSNEKIMLVSNNNNRGYGNLWRSADKSQPKHTAEVSRANITSYKSGKLSKDKFVSTIKFTESEAKADKKPDLELLSTIFQRMYKADLASTYYTSSGIRYEYLENVGAIFKMKVYSSIENGRDSYRLVTQNKTGLTREERDEAVNSMYPKFEKELKANILDYGKTVKSLKGEESLRFEVKLTECKGCEMPEKLEVIVKQSVLADYNAGKITKENATKKMIVKKS